MTNNELVTALRAAADLMERQQAVIEAARAINDHTFKLGKKLCDEGDRIALIDALKLLD